MLREPSQLSALLGTDFSEEQLSAITAPLEPAVIIAGAGSGKTTVMAARVVWLVASGAVRPEQLLGLTFTRKAAGELGERIRAALVKADLVEDREAGEELILTYDAFAGRLVTEYGLLLGLEPARTITGAHRYRLAAKVVNNATGMDHLSRLYPATVISKVLKLSEELRSHLVEPAALSEHAGLLDQVIAAPRHPDLKVARERSAERLELAALVTDYERAKAELGYVEFADQMAAAARLATEVPTVAPQLRDEFAVVLLDEYQDTSAAQATLLQGMFSGPDPEHGRGHPVTAVGDPCQAIYTWRGAAANNILDFARQFPTRSGDPARSYALSVNRRSGQQILDAANRLATTVRAEPALGAHGLQLDLTAPEGTAPGQVELATYPTWRDELAAIADRIADLHSTGQVSDWSQIAVLARQNDQVAEVFEELQARDIPAEIVGFGGLLELPGVADVVAVLTLLADPTANPAAIRVLTSPRWGIGRRDLARLGRRAADLASTQGRQTGAEESHPAAGRPDQVATPSLVEAIADPGEQGFTGEAKARLARISGELARLRRHSGEPLIDLVQRVIDTLDLTVEMEVARPGGSRPLAAFVAAVAEYVDLDAEASLEGLVAYLEAERQEGIGLERPVVSGADSVQVLTIHKAKGLEWEVVFLPGLADRVFPARRGSGNWLTDSAVLPYPLRGDASAMPQLPNMTKEGVESFKEELKLLERSSEDRLAYVAATRARQLLIATMHFWDPGVVRPRRVSPYFEQLRGEAEVPRIDPPQDNPYDAEMNHADWPVVGDAQARKLRQGLARQVAAARETHRLTGEYPEPDELDADGVIRVAQWRRWATELLAAEFQGPVPAGGPEYLSVTGLARLGEDAEGLAAELRRPMPRLVTRSQRMGTAFHRWLERRYASQPSIFDEPFDADLVGEDFTELRDGFEASRYAELVPLAVEAPFTLVLGGSLVRGRIDAVFSAPDGRPQVVDWKTGDAERADPVQLACYRLAWAELNGLQVDQVDAVFFDLRKSREVRPPALADRLELERMLGSV